jgi:hypothetical protein
MPVSRRRIKIRRLTWRSSRLRVARTSTRRTHPGAVGTGRSCISCWTASVPAMCWWSGSSTGCPGPSVTSCTSLKKVVDAGAGFRSLTEAIDSTTPAGRMMMQMLGAVAEFERAMVKGSRSGPSSGWRVPGRRDAWVALGSSFHRPSRRKRLRWWNRAELRLRSRNCLRWIAQPFPGCCQNAGC